MRNSRKLAITDSTIKSLNTIFIATIILVFLFLLLGIICLIIVFLFPQVKNSFLSFFESLWLIKIFKLHAFKTSINSDLHGLNILDFIVLILIGIQCSYLSIFYKKGSRVWAIIASILCLAAIVLYLVTQIAGRSTVMLAVLITSIVMAKNKSIDSTIFCIGATSSILLFVGDLTVGIQSSVITILFGSGYVLLMVWFMLLSRKMVIKNKSN